MALSNKQKEFVNQYLIDFNGTRAAERSGYSGDDNLLAVTAHGLLRNPKIAELVSQRLRESAMSADEVLMRLAKQARGDIRDYLAVGDDGVDVDLKYAIEAQKTDLIKKLTHKKTVRTDKDDNTTEETYIQIEMYDAQSALQLIGKHHSLFVDRQEVTGKDGGPIEATVKHDLSRLSVDELKAMRDMVAKATNADT